MLCSLHITRNMHSPLNESPSEKEGKSATPRRKSFPQKALNESPSEKEGKSC